MNNVANAGSEKRKKGCEDHRCPYRRHEITVFVVVALEKAFVVARCKADYFCSISLFVVELASSLSPALPPSFAVPAPLASRFPVLPSPSPSLASVFFLALAGEGEDDERNNEDDGTWFCSFPSSDPAPAARLLFVHRRTRIAAHLTSRLPVCRKSRKSTFSSLLSLLLRAASCFSPSPSSTR